MKHWRLFGYLWQSLSPAIVYLARDRVFEVHNCALFRVGQPPVICGRLQACRLLNCSWRFDIVNIGNGPGALLWSRHLVLPVCHRSARYSPAGPHLLPQHRIVRKPARDRGPLGQRRHLIGHLSLLGPAVLHHWRASAGRTSEPSVPQPLNKIVPITRAICGRIQHLTLNGIGALQLVEPLGGAACALGRAAEVEKKQGDGERGKREVCRAPGKKSRSWLRWAPC